MSDWNRVQELFLIVVESPEEERAQLLDSLCAHDSELRAEVESLLVSDRDSVTVIAQAIQGEASLLFDSTLLAGKRLGAYRIVREIGRGGMGAVYLAVRDDEEYQKQVAIKVVKQGMDTADVLNRFRYERQILARLEHPYIARLFDGGSTDEGLPFFVMEYVEGRPVNQFCSGNTLDNRDRCGLFLKILEAVSYAHRNLVVHRDLKPGNIFVTEEGTPKLLDFGVAKLISGNGEGGHTATTLLRPFTPEYASPEQVLGLAVTTSTDIYSLGAVLYELLTDRRAQPITTPTPAEIERAVCDLAVPRPSQIAPSVDEDLDNIVLMAMRKEPERRYHSVDQFAEDIQRYLDGRPILARQDSVTYRLRKFLVRNRLELATVTVLIVGLSGGLASSLLQTRRAEEALRLAESQRLLAMHESARATAEAHRSEEALASEARQRAIAERQTAIAQQERDIAQRQTEVAQRRVGDMIDLANGALFDVHTEVSRLPGSLSARKEIVETTLHFLERLEEESGLDDRMRMALSGAYVKVATLQGSYYTPSLQDFAGAESSLLKAKAIILPLYQSKGTDPKVLDRYLEIEVGLADQASQKDQQLEAIALFSEMLPVVRQLARITACDVNCARKEPALEGRIARAYLKLDDPRGVEHANRQVALIQELVSRYQNEEKGELKREPAYALQTAAEALTNAGDLAAAAEDYRQSNQILEDILRENPTDTFAHRSLVASYEGYATLLGIPSSPNLGRWNDAAEIANKAVVLTRESVKLDPKDATARYDLGVALGTLGRVPPSQDGIQASLASLQEAADLLYPIVKANPTAATKAVQLAMVLEFIGHRLLALERYEQAIESYRKSLGLLQPLLELGSHAVIIQSLASEESLALACALTGERTAALDSATRALTRAEKLSVTPPLSEKSTGYLAKAYATMATVQDKAGNSNQARQAAEDALKVWKKVRNRGVVSIHAGTMADTQTLLAELSASSQGRL